MRTEGKNRWLRLLVANVLLAIAIAFVFNGVGIRTPWRQGTEAVATAFLFAICIGPITGWAMRRIVPALWRRLRFPLNWIGTGSVAVGCALVGNALAVTVLTAAGFLPPAEYWHWFVGTMRISVAVTLAIGLFVTALEVQRAQMAESTARAQLAALESRVQPHFLFNTLNSIAALVHEDPSGAERMTTQLASLLRSSLDAQHAPLVPLVEELALVRNYLEIERVRFGDRLHYAISVDDAAADAGLPRMAVQTLVENSVKYAVSPRREGGSINIRAVLADGRVRVEVRDDGPGFDGAHLPEGHGLALLRDRLAAQFGGLASLRIDGTPGAAVVTLELPHEQLILRKLS